MDEVGRSKVVSGIDFLVAIFIFIVGFIVILYGNDWLTLMSTIPSSQSMYSSPYTIFNKLPWIIILTGAAITVYGVKRLVDDIIRVFMKRNQ